MTDEEARYGLALPDNGQYRGLVDRLPPLVWHRLALTVFFASKDASEFSVERVDDREGGDVVTRWEVDDLDWAGSEAVRPDLTIGGPMLAREAVRSRRCAPAPPATAREEAC